jgi:hypothetical protein
MNSKVNYKLAPIVLFVYDRPEHTKSTLFALKNNELAKESMLYVYCDGPKENAGEEELNKNKKSKKIIKRKPMVGNIEIIESETNLGLATSIKKGVTEVFRKHDRIIVLEDDLVTSPAFLTYMNDALDFYEKRKSVFSISGYCLPPSKLKIPAEYPFDVFVSLRPFSWGWGTWIDRWNQIDWNTRNFPIIAHDFHVREAFNRGGDDVFSYLEDQKTGKLDIWTSPFVYAHFINHAVSILPVHSYVENIGMDGSGMHCSPTLAFKNDTLCENKNSIFLEILYEDKRIINSFYNAYCHKKRPLWKKFIIG